MKFFNMVRFTKEGKGVDPNKPKKRAFFRYIELLWRKRFKLISSNLLYFVTNIPATLVTIVVYYLITALLLTLSGAESTESWIGNAGTADIFYISMVFIVIFFTSLPIFSIGPFQAGFTFLLKSFVKEEPVFLWTDFTTKARSNKKLSIKVSIINGIIGFLLLLDAVVYFRIASDTTGIFAQVPGILLFIAATFIIFGFTLFFMMNIYIYPMVVTFKITIKQLYKNAFIFSLIRWFPNLLLLLAEIAIVALPLLVIPGFYAFLVSVALYLFITPALIGFTNNFYAYPLIKKYMIDNPAADKSGNASKAPTSPQSFVPTEGMERFVNGRYLDDEEYAALLKEREQNSGKESEIETITKDDEGDLKDE